MGPAVSFRKTVLVVRRKGEWYEEAKMKGD